VLCMVERFASSFLPGARGSNLALSLWRDGGFTPILLCQDYRDNATASGTCQAIGQNALGSAHYVPRRVSKSESFVPVHSFSLESSAFGSAHRANAECSKLRWFATVYYKALP